MFCRNCGIQNDEGMTFCKNCGASLVDSNVSNNQVSVDNAQSVDVNPLIQNQSADVNNVTNVQNTVTSEVQPVIQNQGFDVNNVVNNQNTTGVQPVIQNQNVNTNNTNGNVNSNVNGSTSNPGGGKKKVIIIIIIIVAVVLLVVLGVVLRKFSGGKTGENKVKLFDQNAYIVVKKDGKYGYINTDGNFVLEAKYLKASSFVGDYAIVKVENTDTKDYHSEIYEIIDKKGNVKAQAYYESDLKYIEDKNVWIINKQLYDEKIKKISSDDVEVSYQDGYLEWNSKDKKSAGIMNIKGKVTYTYKFGAEENSFYFEVSDDSDKLKQQYCRINVYKSGSSKDDRNDKYAIVNCNTGKVVYDYTDNYIYDEDYNSFEISTKDDHKFIELIYIQDDKILFKSTDKDSSVRGYTYSYGYIELYEANAIDENGYHGKHSYVDLATGKIVNSTDKITKKNEKTEEVKLDDFESVTKYTKFSCNNGYGVMNGDKVIIPCEWKKIEYFDLSIYNYLASKGKKYVLAEDDKNTVLLDLKTGKTVATFESTYVDSNGGIFLTYSTSTDKFVYNLLNNTSKAFNVRTSVTASSNYVIVKYDSKIEYYNGDFKLIYTEER